ncbi:MAG: HAMP domain-containing histidine kinase [Elusimicrobiota bacterium]|nr:HAMP domain-containing histidine kinase [Elusimicrobiota bacterium]
MAGEDSGKHKEAERKLKQKIRELKTRDRVKEEFLTLALHKLRSPLTPIKEYVSKILNGKTGDINPQQKRYLDIVQRQVERLIRLVEELSELSPVKSGRLGLNKEPIALLDIIDGVVESLRKEAENKGISLCVESPASQPIVRGDEKTLREVFTKLVKNSLNETPSGGKVIFSVRGEPKVIGQNKFVEILFPDTAGGIGQGKTGNKESAGLGLFMVRSIVEAQGGKVRFEDESRRLAILLPFVG